MTRLLNKLTVGFTLALLGLGGAGLLTYQTAVKHQETAALVAHSQKVRGELGGLRSHAQEVEGNVLLFVITGREQDLKPIGESAGGVRHSLRAVRSLTADNSAQQRRLAETEATLDRRLGEIEAIVAVRRELGFAPAKAAATRPDGRGLMEDIDELARAMLDAEAELLERRENLEGAYAADTRLVVAAGFVSALLIVLLLSVLFVRQGHARARAEANARGNQARNAAILESTQDCMIAVDAEGRITEFNPAAEWTFGHRRQAALGEDFVGLLVPGPEQEGRRNWLTRFLRRGRDDLVGNRVEMTARRIDGSELPVELTMTALVIDGVPLFTATLRDVSERKLAERRRRLRLEVTRILAEAQTSQEMIPRLLQTVGENLGAVVTEYWARGADDRLGCQDVWQSPGTDLARFVAVTKQTRFARGEGLPGRVWGQSHSHWLADVAGADTLPRAEAARQDGVTSGLGSAIHSEEELLGVVCAFSSEQWMPLPDLMEMLDALGNRLGLFLQRKKVEETTRASEARLRAIMDTAVDAILTVSEGGQIDTFNPAAERAFGYRAAEVVGAPVAMLAADADPSHYLRAGHWQGEGRRRDGSTFAAELSVSEMRVSEQRMFTCIARDVSSRKQAEEETRRAREAAEQASRAKSDFLANMSHEIRTPMNGILGMTELVLDTDLTPEQREYLEIVKESGDSLLTIINEILDFSKIEAGKLSLENAAFSLHDSLGVTMKSLAQRAHLKGLDLAYHIDESVPEHLVGDAARIRQVLVNLVGNALKFTEQGEVTVTVTGVRRPERLAADAPDVLLLFEVKDTGIGIPPDRHQAVFNAFEQGDGSTTRKYGGTGLGLAITARFVQLMGGRVWVESTPGQGSTFRFTVPQNRAASPTPGPPRSLGVRCQGQPVLVVDDNATNRKLFYSLLSRWGLRPRAVAGGEEALRLLEEARAGGRPFALVLADVVMPGMDGFSLAERVQKTLGPQAPPLVMLSSANRREDADRCRAMGLARYLVKPVTPSELFDAVAHVLGRVPELAPPGPKAARESGSALRVLLAEDNSINQKLAVRLLEKQGHSVRVAGNGMEALAALDRDSFDVVLMDVQMPEMGGFEATAAVRKREAGAEGRLPIIALTAHALKGDRERCLEAGMDDYLTKPLHPDELVRVLARLGLKQFAPTRPAGSETPALAAERNARAGEPVC
jgi:PAS domain S-box-containing protein